MRQRTKKIANKYNSTAHYYDSRYQKIQHSKYVLIEDIINHDTPSICLDVGSGTGLFRRFLSNYTYPRIIGIDISPNMLIISKTGLPKNKPEVSGDILADSDYPPFRSSLFHYIVSFTHLQNTPRPKTTIKAFKRLCKSKGIIVASILKKNLDPTNVQNWFREVGLNPVKLISNGSVEDLILVASKK